MFALAIFCLFMSRRVKPGKAKTIHHYFNEPAPEGHVPDESEIPYWTVQLPEHY